MIDPDILRGAIKRAAGNELGLTEDQVTAIEIDNLRQRVLENRAHSGINDAARRAANDFDFNAAEIPAVIKEFDVDGGPSLNEYGLDQSDMILKVSQDKDFTNSEQRSKDTYIQDLQYEDEARRGLFAEDFDDEPSDKAPWHPRRNNQPELDDFVVKNKGVPLGFVKNKKSGRYTVRSNEPDAKIKAVMAKRRSNANQTVYRENAASSSVQIPGLSYSGKGGFVDAKVDAELFYPGASNNGPNVGAGPGQSPIQHGKANDLDIFNKLTVAINTGQITDPNQLIEAEQLRSEIKRRIDPQYEKAIIFDQGVKTAREDSKRFSSEKASNNRRRNAERSVIGSFLPSEANLKGLGEQEVQLEGMIGGKKSYIKTISAKTAAEMRNMPLARMVVSPDDSIYGYADNQGNLINPSLVSDVENPGNIPKPTTQGPTSLMDVMELNQYRSRESGTYPQVDIGKQLGILSQRLGKTGLLPAEANLGVRNLEQTESLLNQAIEAGKSQGVKFNAFGKREIVNDPGVMELLAKMRYTSPEVAAFGNAMIQLELGNRNNVNLDRKNSFLTTQGGYMPQGMMGYPHVDPSNPANSIILGNDRIEFNRADRMQDYQVGENISYANSRVAPQFRSLTGTTLTDLPANERASVLNDAKRPYVGLVDGEDVPIAGQKGNPNYRFNKTGITDPRDIAVRLRAQAERRAQANNRKVDRTRLLSNIKNNIAVTQRHLDAQSTAAVSSEPDVKQEIAKRLGVQEHITRQISTNRSHYKPSEKQAKFYDSSRSLEENIGASSMGIEAPAKKEQTEREYSVVDVPNAPDVPEGFIPKSERQNRIGKFKESLGSAFNKYGKGNEYTVGRRVGYGGAAIVGLSGLAGLISGERENRNQEVYQ